MKFTAAINVMPIKEILDPQGKAVTGSLKNIGLESINNVRIGKHITLEVEADHIDSAREQVDIACKKLLSNVIMETYSFKIQEI